MAQLRETSTLPIIETKASSFKPRLQHAILFTQEDEHILVFTSKQPHKEPLGRSPGPFVLAGGSATG